MICNIGHAVKSNRLSAILGSVLIVIFLLAALVPSTADAAVLDVKSFGAKGDGVTDDTTAVQKAINSAVTGDTLVFNGVFSVSKLTVSGKSNLTLKGTGTIKQRVNNTLISVTNSPNFRIEGLTIDGNAKNWYLLDIQNSSYFVIENSTFKNLGNGTTTVSAIYIAPNSNNGLIKGNVFDNIVADRIARAIWVNNYRDRSKLAANITITGNLFKNIRPAGDGDAVVVDQGGNSNILISGNTFENVHKRAVKVMGNGVTAKDNIVKRNNIGLGFAALSAYGDNITFQNNNVVATGNSNYYWLVDVKGSNVKVLNNHLENSPTANNSGCDGISIDALLSGSGSYSNIEVSGNTIRNARYGIRNVSGATVNGIKILDNKFYGILNNVIHFDAKVDKPNISSNYSAPSPNFFIRFSTNPASADIQNNTANAKNGFYTIASGGTPTNSLIWNNTNNGIAVNNLNTTGSSNPSQPSQPTQPADTTPPVASGTDPVHQGANIPVDKTVTVTFSENIQAGSAYSGIKMTDPSGKNVTLNVSISGNKLVIKPTANLAYNTKHEVSIPKSAVRDAAGNNLAVDYLLEFTTVNAPLPADTTPPVATSTDPVHQSTGIPVNKTVTVTFNENIQAGSALSGIKMTDPSGRNVSLNVSISGNKLVIKPVANLARNTKHQVWIPKSAVRDLAGNNLAVDYMLEFTTIR